MTTVTADNNGIVINGHANSGKAGQDLVCSACSILMYTAIEALKECATVEMSDSGYCSIKLNDHSLISRVRLDTILTGYRLLARDYPNNVSVKEETHGNGNRNKR